MNFQFFADLLGIFVWGSIGLALALAILAFPVTFFIYCVRYGWRRATKESDKKE